MSGMQSAKAAEWALQGGYSDVHSYNGSWSEYSKLPNELKIQ
jgi:3-mercaptopyruvate sulfurtransferase SseA